jgi:hypothetical protein
MPWEDELFEADRSRSSDVDDDADFHESDADPGSEPWDPPSEGTMPPSPAQSTGSSGSHFVSWQTVVDDEAGLLPGRGGSRPWNSDDQ